METFDSHRFLTVTELVAAAIDRSVQMNCSINIEANRRYQAVCDELFELCEVANTENDGTREYCGVRVDPDDHEEADEWRVCVLPR